MAAFGLGQLGDIEIKQLKIFKAVAECGGFSAAETELNISRPTISNHIAALESRLNISLCKRGRGGFALTEEGTVVYEQTCKLLDRMDRFRNTINNLGEQPAGKLKIALSDTFCSDQRCRVPEILRQFCLKAPEVELQMEVEHMKTMEKMVLNNQLDLAIIPYHREFEGLDYMHLFTDFNYLYCGREHPLFNLRDELITEQMIQESKLIHAGLKPHEEIYHQLTQMNLAGSSYHYESRIAMVLSGCFISFLPEEIARPYVERGELKAIATKLKTFRLGVAVISKRTTQANRARDLFLNTIRQVHTIAENAAPY